VIHLPHFDLRCRVLLALAVANCYQLWMLLVYLKPWCLYTERLSGRITCVAVVSGTIHPPALVFHKIFFGQPVQYLYEQFKETSVRR